MAVSELEEQLQEATGQVTQLQQQLDAAEKQSRVIFGSASSMLHR